MKKLTLLFLFVGYYGFSQVGVGTTAPESTLDIVATNPTGTSTAVDGILIPRVDRQRAQSMTGIITSTMIYVNSVATGTAGGTAVNITSTGFYYFDGTVWQKIIAGASTNWNLTGNTGTTAGTNFIGTTDGVDFRIKTGGADRWNISDANNGQLQSYSLGTAAVPTYSFQGDTNTGLFSSGADALDFATNGISRFRIPNANQVHALSLGTAALPFYSFSADPDTGLYSSGANSLDFSTNGTSRMQIDSNGNVGIATAATASSVLDMSSVTNKAMEVPNVALAATTTATIAAPATGAMVYNTATASSGATAVFPGYYYWNGAKWVSLGGGSGGNDWSLTGNAGTSAATNYVGTSDAVDFRLGTNGTERLRVLQGTGQLIMPGYSTSPFSTDRFSVYNTAAGAATDYAINGYSQSTGVGVYGQNSGTGFGVQGTSASSGLGVFGSNTGTTGMGVYGQNTSTGYGVYGYNNSTGYAVRGANAGSGLGVYGTSTNGTGNLGAGVNGAANSTGGTGVFGSSTGTNGNGVWGNTTGAGAASIYGTNTSAATGYGVFGSSTGTTGYGVYGAANQANRPGVYGINDNATGNGVYGTSIGTTGYGVYGISSGTSGVGVYGTENQAGRYGVWGNNNNNTGIGVYGNSTGTTAYGVNGVTTGIDATAVFGSSTGSNADGVSGLATGATGYGVWGRNDNNTGNGTVGSSTGGLGNGVLGIATGATGYGVYGSAAGATGYGVYGINDNPTGYAVVGTTAGANGRAVYGTTTGSDGTAIYGSSTGATADGVYGQATGATAYGVWGVNNNATGIGVVGSTTGASGAGVYGTASSATGSGVSGTNANATGTGVIASGNNAGPVYIVGGSGGAFNGNPYGSVAWATNTATGIGVAGAGNNEPITTLGTTGAGGAFTGNQWAVTGISTITGAGNDATDRGVLIGNYVSGGTTIDNVYVGARVGGVNYKILGTGGGSVSTTMKTSQGERILFAPEATENWFFDMGEVTLVNGKATVNLDPVFVETLSDSKPFKVFVQGGEDTLGSIRITRNQTDKSFIVEDLGGASNGIVQYSVYGIWKGKENLRLPELKEEDKPKQVVVENKPLNANLASKKPKTDVKVVGKTIAAKAKPVQDVAKTTAAEKAKEPIANSKEDTAAFEKRVVSELPKEVEVTAKKAELKNQ